MYSILRCRERFACAQNGVLRILQRWGRDTSGATAIEFGFVALPFFMFMFGIIALGLYFFVSFSLENAVERSARMVRTGQAQTAGMTTDQFKIQVCSDLPNFSDCASNLRVNVIAASAFDGFAEPECIDGTGQLMAEATPSAVPGSAGEVVLITACYEWELAAIFPFLKLGNMANGSALIRASTTFRTEPYQ